MSRTCDDFAGRDLVENEQDLDVRKSINAF
jgi:hypothetical protein